MTPSNALLSITLLSILVGCVTVKPTAVPPNQSPSTIKQASNVEITPVNDEVAANEQLNFAVLCSPHTYVQHLEDLPAPKTGTERKTPIILMTRQEFNDKIQQSPLWESLSDKKLSNGNYGSSYRLTAMIDEFGFDSYIAINNHYTYISKPTQKIKTLSYGNFYTYLRSKYKHQLLKQERYEMIEMITLVIDDRAKATEIVDTLYKQYMEKFNNKEYLSDNKTIFTYIEYEGIYFSMYGLHITDHWIPECNFSLLTGLSIH